MLQKWKDILTNWINCYFNECEKREQCVTLDSLLNIISHLRENLNLDESKSSILEAHTVEEFIQEKYPEFRLENGSVEASGEDETCYVASLLLYFVCVNSKDVGMKSAMCNKLSGEDQETILKFSKRLMECSSVTLKDVQAAISEACGQDDPSTVSASGSVVGATPPALRSLHGEVRRLQAALDAERFDRNYLQEELARTNLRVDKLAKEKEQYKLEILNLKAKISMCCGQEADSRAGDAAAESTAKLMRQLGETEERLVHTQGLLDDAQYERDTYRAKINELKQERDKWLATSQQEAARVSQLAEELESERRHVHSLRELVTELRQHNQLNRLDSSQLECDDPDASIHSLQHNSSVCSEACANVIEVQLGEERAKIVVLKQHIESLQEQLNDLTQKSESGKLALERIVSERENDIFNLKHRINEEIEEKNNLTIQYSDDVSKLNNEINELEQKLKDNNNQCRLIVESKMQEIQTLQEEKLSLLQSLTDETTKLENDIKSLTSQLEVERNSKAKMKDSYESHIMKLNEKVLNRNNELVELQNNVFEKSEQIETLYMEIRKEKQAKDELIAKHRDEIEEINGKFIVSENMVQRKSEEIESLVKRLNYNFDVMKECEREIQDLKYSLSQQNENSKILEETKVRLLEELTSRDNKIEELHKDIDNMRNVHSEEQDKLRHDLDSAIATVNTLQMQLQDELQYKIGLQNEHVNLEHAKSLLLHEVEKQKEELNKLQSEIKNKEQTIEGMDLFIQEEKRINEKIKFDCQDLNDQLKQMSEEINIKNNELKEIEEKKKDELLQKEQTIESITKQLSTEVELKAKIELMINNEREKVSQEILEKSKEVAELREQCNKMNEIIQHNRKCFQIIESKLEEETLKCAHLEKSFDTHTTKLMHKLNITERVIKELKTKYKQADEDKKLKIEVLKVEIGKLNGMIEKEREHVATVQRERDTLAEKLAQELSYRMEFEKEYQNQVIKFTDITAQLNGEIVSKNKEMNEKLEALQKSVDEKQEEIKILEEELSIQKNSQKEITKKKEEEINELKYHVSELKKDNEMLTQDLKNEIDNRNHTMQVLQKENEQLHFTIEEDNISHEMLKKEKDSAIEKLEERLRIANVQLESIQKEFEDSTFTFEKYKIDAQESLKVKDTEINKLRITIRDLDENLEQNLRESEKVQSHLSSQVHNLKEKYMQAESKRHEDLMSYIDEMSSEETKFNNLATSLNTIKDELIEEKNMRIKFQTESHQLQDEIRLLKQQLTEMQTAHNILIETNKDLQDEKAMLTQQLIEEKSTRKIVEEQKEMLAEEKVALTEKLDVEWILKSGLLEDKERLTQQLVEEKSAKELAEKEKENMAAQILEETKAKENLIQELYIVMQEDMSLRQQLKQVEIEKQKLKNDNETLVSNLDEEKGFKDELVKEKDGLVDEIEIVKRDLSDAKVLNDRLSNDINRMTIEKESLLNSLQETKVACEELEMERDRLLKSISVLKEQDENHIFEMKEKQVELETIMADLARIKTKKEENDDAYAQVTFTLKVGIDKLLDNLKKEEIGNEVLRKLICIDDSKLSIKEKCDLVINIANTLTTELSLRRNLEVALEYKNTALGEMRQMLSQKEMQVLELQTEINRLQQIVNEYKIEMSKQRESYATSADVNARNIQTLQQENQSLISELNDVKVQLDVKVHSLKEKLIDNENLTEKLKKTYECQIENLNVMVTKLTNYLKDKTVELDVSRKEKERLQEIVEDNNNVIRTLEEEVKAQKQNQDKLLSEFESERLVLKNMVTVTESVMEDQKLSLGKTISEHLKALETLKVENNTLKEAIEAEEKSVEIKMKEKDALFENVLKELTEMRSKKENLQKDLELEKQSLVSDIERLKKDLCMRVSQVEILELQNKELTNSLQNCKHEITALEECNNELKIKLDSQQIENADKVEKISKELDEQIVVNNNLKLELEKQCEVNKNIEVKIQDLCNEMEAQTVAYENLKREKSEYEIKVTALKTKLDQKALEMNREIKKLLEDNLNLVNTVVDNKTVITKMEQIIEQEKEQNNQIRESIDSDKMNLNNKCSILQEYQTKAEIQLEGQQKDIATLQVEVRAYKSKVDTYEQDLKEKDNIIKEKEQLINAINDELAQVKTANEKHQADLKLKITEVNELRQKVERVGNDDVMRALRSEEWVKAVGQRETFAAPVSEKTGTHKNSGPLEKEYRDFLHQVDNTTSDLTHSSLESIKTISDLEKIIYDKNRTITTLQSDITYLKSLIADSENKLLDVTKELEVSKENCLQLSGQLKKIVHQKNEEIAELKRQVNKMSVTENRATQIIKVSAKYQAIILKRIAEIKSNTVLKELTNFGNSANGDNDIRRSLNAGTITIEDLENFLETTDKHLKRCSEKQVALQKERDRLTEVNRINESEIINLKKFLTELSVSFKTFSTVRDLYAQKFSRVVQMQRTVRREILSLDGRANDATMCKLERGYAAVMQDLAECVMNMERWVERCIGRTISTEKIKQAFTGDEDRASLASATFQNTSLEVQLEELENSFQKLLEEVVRAQKGEGAKDAQAVTVMEVRAEYEDKLNRMKAKMKQLYQEQISVYKEKQKEEIAMLERELSKTRERMAEASKAYEEHIRALTAELWSVGEKFLTKKDEVDWLRKRQRSGSLMSLQHVHSSGLVPPLEEPSRPSDTHSLRSLPVNNNVTATNTSKREGRGLHMSDEEGEVFDNRWLKELAATPGRGAAASTPSRPARLSELRWRNSLCPPHLKSSYPAETQFAPALDEEDIKFSLGGASSIGGRNQRKEVGITAYKKPGPPTPSKQAGRLSATDSELRESLRVEAEPQPARKTSTPSRLRSLFRSARNDTAEGTPRSKRLSIFRKK